MLNLKHPISITVVSCILIGTLGCFIWLKFPLGRDVIYYSENDGELVLSSGESFPTNRWLYEKDIPRFNDIRQLASEDGGYNLLITGEEIGYTPVQLKGVQSSQQVYVKEMVAGSEVPTKVWLITK